MQDPCLFHLTSVTFRRRGFPEEDFACNDETLALTFILADEPEAPSAPRQAPGGEGKCHLQCAATGWTSRSLNAARHSVRPRSYPGPTGLSRLGRCGGDGTGTGHYGGLR